eukprot:7002926-Pyramimonas_sp.AAC.1
MFPRVSQRGAWWKRVSAAPGGLLEPRSFKVWSEAVNRLGSLARTHFLPDADMYWAWSGCLAKARLFPAPVAKLLLHWARAAADAEAKMAAKQKEIDWK